MIGEKQIYIYAYVTVKVWAHIRFKDTLVIWVLVQKLKDLHQTLGVPKRTQTTQFSLYRCFTDTLSLTQELATVAQNFLLTGRNPEQDQDRGG